VTSKPGRPLGRRGSRSSIVGHPGASPEKGETCFPSSPRSPLLHNGAQLCGAMDAAGPMDVANGRAAHRSLEIASRFPQHPQPKPKVFGDTINPSTKSGQLHYQGTERCDVARAIEDERDGRAPHSRGKHLWKINRHPGELAGGKEAVHGHHRKTAVQEPLIRRGEP